MDSRHLILLGLLSGVVGMSYVVWKVRAGRIATFSLHAAERKDTYVVFALCLTLAAIFYHLFARDYLVPATHASPWFTISYSLLILSVVIVGWIRDKEGWERRIHYGIVTLMMWLSPIITFSLSFADISTFSYIVTLISTGASLVIIYLFYFVRSSHQYILWYQGFYLLLLNASLLSVAYL